MNTHERAKERVGGVFSLILSNLIRRIIVVFSHKTRIMKYYHSYFFYNLNHVLSNRKGKHIIVRKKKVNYWNITL